MPVELLPKHMEQTQQRKVLTMCIVSKNIYATEMKRLPISNECSNQQLWYYIMPQDTLNATDFTEYFQGSSDKLL